LATNLDPPLISWNATPNGWTTTWTSATDRQPVLLFVGNSPWLALPTQVFWLNWTRSGENFEVCFKHVTVTEPGDGATIDLPPICGAVGLKLPVETKSSWDHQADVWMAFNT